MDSHSKSLKRILGIFLHGIDLNNWYPCWNLSLIGRLWSPDFIARVESGIAAVHRSMRDIEIGQLKVGNIQPGVVTPRAAQYVCVASIIRE